MTEDMYNRYRQMMFDKYNAARADYIANPDRLIKLEQFMTEQVKKIIKSHLNEIIHDFNEASYLNPFWASYPPVDRGRASIGDQIPWIEVGEQAVGEKVKRFAPEVFEHVDDIAVPDGPDHRIGITDSSIGKILKNTNSAMLFLDTKTVGPRDDKPEVVASTNQVCGNGHWDSVVENVTNDVILSRGSRATHEFQPALSPLIVDSDGHVRPVVIIFIKPVYSMNNLEKGTGQPLKEIKLVTIPNGLLLSYGPCYLEKYGMRHLFYPGKDDKTTPPLKRRSRINANILQEIDSWRYQIIKIR